SVLLAAAATLLGITAANAAEPTLPDTVNTPAFSWSGAYLGGQIGHDWGKSRFTDPNFSEDIDANGFGGGLYAGYNFDLGSNLIIGLEGDITYNNAKGQFAEDLGGIITGADSELRWSGTVRARAGYAIDR